MVCWNIIQEYSMFFYSTCQSLLKLFSLTGLKTVFFIKAEVTQDK